MKWGNSFSDEFDVPLGTKQGGISSPKFFALYVNDLILLLRKRGLGCHVMNIFIGCILFADDLALLAPSRRALQVMIDIVADYLKEFCLDLNVKKSVVMVFGKSSHEVGIAPLMISTCSIDFVFEWRYLGVTISAGKSFAYTARHDISSFYRATNSIFSLLKGAHEQVLLNLLYTNCVPVLSYACAVKEYSNSDMSECNLAMNHAFQKIFGFTQWQSIRYLREAFGLKSIYLIFKEAQDRFLNGCLIHPNSIVNFLSHMN